MAYKDYDREPDWIFLNPNYLFCLNQDLRLPPDCLQELISAAGIISQDISCRRQFSLLWVRIYPEQGQAEPFDLPDFSFCLAKLAPLLPLLLLVAKLPDLKNHFMNRHIKEDVWLETISDIRLHLLSFHKRHGYYGLDEFWWLTLTVIGKIYRLGRLQFMPLPFKMPIEVYRHIAGDRVVALSAPGISFRRDGQVSGTNGIEADSRGFTADLRVEDNLVWGTPIDPRGRALNREICLDLNKWRKVLSRENTILDLHIPADGRLDLAACLDSFTRADDFFPRHFPEIKAPAVICKSWLLSPQIPEILYAQSNLVQFQQQLYLFPVKDGDQAFIKQIFGQYPPPEPGDRENSLQRSLRGYLDQGKRVNSGAMFFLLADLPRWGQGWYRRQFNGLLADQESSGRSQI